MLATADSDGNECSRKSERKRSTCSELGIAIFVEVSSSTCIEVESGGHWVFVGERPGGKSRHEGPMGILHVDLRTRGWL